MADTKFASLVVLSYNRRDTMRRSLESLHENTGYPYELIVCDDASNAETQEYLFAELRAGRISTLVANSHWNRGIGPQFNRGVACAKGDIILKLDADLIYKPGWLEEVVRILEGHPEVGSLGLFKYWHQPCNFPDELIADRGDFFEVVDYVGSALAFRRHVWTRFGPWYEGPERTFSEDIVFKKAMQDAGLLLALPKEDLADNVGFGEHLTSLIKEVDWKGGKHTYNLPTYRPVLFSKGRLL